MLHMRGIIFISAVLEARSLVLMDSQAPTPNAGLGAVWAAKAGVSCSAENLNREGFAAPVNGFSSFLTPGSRLFIVGDDVTGDLCELGSPGFCCSRSRPCEAGGGTMLRDGAAGQSWEVSLKEGREGWDSLRKFALRTRGGTAMGNAYAYVLGATVPANRSQVTQPVSLIRSFLQEMNASSRDVMIVGLLGWKQGLGLATFDAFTQGLFKQVVNTFPGRTVILSASPAHAAGGVGGGWGGGFGGATGAVAAAPPAVVGGGVGGGFGGGFGGATGAAAAAPPAVVGGGVGSGFGGGFGGATGAVAAAPPAVEGARPGSSLLGLRPAAGASCLPTEQPGELDPPSSAFRNAILVYNVWKDLTNERARLVDVHDMLVSLSSCHRDASCRTWNDATISMVAQLVLNALQKIH